MAEFFLFFPFMAKIIIIIIQFSAIKIVNERKEKESLPNDPFPKKTKTPPSTTPFLPLMKNS